MGSSNDVNIGNGVEISPVEVTQIDLLPGQAALIVYPEGVTMVLPEGENPESSVPQHVLFVTGVYFSSEEPAFIERMIRVAIDRLASAKKLDD